MKLKSIGLQSEWVQQWLFFEYFSCSAEPIAFNLHKAVLFIVQSTTTTTNMVITKYFLVSDAENVAIMKKTLNLDN